MFQRLSKSIYKEFIFGGHFQSLGASGIVLAAYILLGGEINIFPIIIAYFIFYPLYLFNRLWEIKNDYSTNPERTDYFLSYIKWMPLIFIIESFLTIFFLIFYSPNIIFTFFGLFLYILGLLYTILIKRITVYIIILKNIYVALFFASLVPFAVVFNSGDLNKNVLVLTVLVFLKGLLMQIILDIKDIESDQKDKLLTIPSKLGKEKTIVFSIWLLIFVNLIIPFYLYFSGFFGIELLFTLASIFVYFYSLKLIKYNNYNGYIIVSGEYLFWAFFILIGRFYI